MTRYVRNFELPITIDIYDTSIEVNVFIYPLGSNQRWLAPYWMDIAYQVQCYFARSVDDSRLAVIRAGVDTTYRGYFLSLETSPDSGITREEVLKHIDDAHNFLKTTGRINHQTAYGSEIHRAVDYLEPPLVLVDKVDFGIRLMDHGSILSRDLKALIKEDIKEPAEILEVLRKLWTTPAAEVKLTLNTDERDALVTLVPRQQ